jgi:hypothetical protein
MLFSNSLLGVSSEANSMVKDKVYSCLAGQIMLYTCETRNFIAFFTKS